MSSTEMRCYFCKGPLRVDEAYMWSPGVGQEELMGYVGQVAEALFEEGDWPIPKICRVAHPKCYERGDPNAEAQ